MMPFKKLFYGVVSLLGTYTYYILKYVANVASTDLSCNV